MAKSVSAKINAAFQNPGSFDLNQYKKSRSLDKNTRYKKQEYLLVSPALRKLLNIPGIPTGHLTILRGHSNTGKTTAMIEAAIACQRQGILPILIITEMKWNWERAIKMGFQAEQTVDEDGVVDYQGFFLYVDKMSLPAIEDVAFFINSRFEDQKKGLLPHDLCFLWDSVGSVTSRRSIESKNTNNMWDAGALSNEFGKYINQQFGISRKEGQPYTNTFIVVNKVWVDSQNLGFMEQPKLKNKGGDTMFYDATIEITFGKVTSSGVSKVKASKTVKGVKTDYTWGWRSRVSVTKNHITGNVTEGYLISTAEGFIDDTKEAHEAYKEAHKHEWVKMLGEGEGEIEVEVEQQEIETVFDTRE